MRIVELRFENLNSLVGRWQIDLEQPEFVSDGIFAITGPTGAGKTTVLDAICLALYGSTPRLGRLGKGTNELMSRQTGQCFAQVTFETRSGRYISQWSQHRARKKAGGDLQAPRHEISEAATGKILSSSVKESSALVVELTGMSFEQFTRSMMLAQGAFAAFLQAKSDERAPILEQITGSEIYSEISVLVHKYRGEQESRLQALKQQLDGRALLSDEQRTQLQQEFDRLQLQVQTLQASQNQMRAQLQARQQLDLNAWHLQQHASKQQAHQQRSAAFEPDRARLLLARRTLDLAPDCRALELARQEQQTDQLNLQRYQAQQPDSQVRLEAAQQGLRAQETQWLQHRSELERMQPILEQARVLDANVAQQRSRQAALLASEQDAKTRTQRLHADAKHLQQQRDQATQTLDEVKQKMLQCHTDSTLPAALSGLVQGLEAWVTLDRGVRQLAQKQQEHAVRLEQTQRLALGLKARWQTVEQQHQALQTGVQEHEKALAKSLQGRRLVEWQQHYSQILERQQRCQRALQLWQEMSSLTQTLATDQQSAQDLQHRTQQLDITIKQLQHELTLQQAHMDSLRQQEALQRRIETYEQARAHLHEGEPCPLCGALEHPFAQGVVGSMDHLQQQITACQQSLTRLDRGLSDQQIERNKLIYQREELEKRVLIQQSALRQCQLEQPGVLEALGVTLIPVNQTVGAVLDTLQRELGLQGQQTQQILEDAGHRSAALQGALQDLQQSAQAQQQLQSQCHQAQQQYEQARLQVEQAEQSRAEQAQQRGALTDKLSAQLSIYGVPASVFEQREQVPEVQALLTQRRDAWLHLQVALQQAEQVLPTIEQSMRHVHEQLQLQQEELQRMAQEQAQLQKIIEQCLQQRKQLLGAESPVEVGRRLAAMVEQARLGLEQAREHLNQVQMAHQTLLNRQAALKDAMAQRQQRLVQMQTRLQVGLDRQGFESEAALQAAMLSDTQRQQLESQERQLLNEISALEAEKITLHSEQARLSVMVDVSQTLEVLEQQLREVEQGSRQATEQMGSLRQRLSDDDCAKRESESLWEQVKLQQTEFDHWNALHGLIGSADGKKFRTFAQGLTFEVVIQHANRQLQRMSDRYVLVRGESEPLELNVIDQYQAAEVRTTKNLSGGESFLVSLALALGLSNMASRKIRVDSLFLDEGFGTLDEDALDLALQTLSTLHQEGKLIGVISHVQALKDRIATQIQVTPARGGRSVLQGPGCMKLTDELA